MKEELEKLVEYCADEITKWTTERELGTFNNIEDFIYFTDDLIASLTVAKKCAEEMWEG